MKIYVCHCVFSVRLKYFFLLHLMDIVHVLFIVVSHSWCKNYGPCFSYAFPLNFTMRSQTEKTFSLAYSIARCKQFMGRLTFRGKLNCYLFRRRNKMQRKAIS